MQLLKRFLGAIAGSKKAVATVANILWIVVVAPLSGKLGYPIPLEQVIAVSGSLAAYALSQGWADSGKEAAKITAATVTPIKKPAAVK